MTAVVHVVDALEVDDLGSLALLEHHGLPLDAAEVIAWQLVLLYGHRGD